MDIRKVSKEFNSSGNDQMKVFGKGFIAGLTSGGVPENLALHKVDPVWAEMGFSCAIMLKEWENGKPDQCATYTSDKFSMHYTRKGKRVTVNAAVLSKTLCGTVSVEIKQVPNRYARDIDGYLDLIRRIISSLSCRRMDVGAAVQSTLRNCIS